MKRVLLGALVLALASPACGDTLRVNQANLVAAVSRAQPGDVIQLPAGEYALPPLKRIVKSGRPVIIEPMPGARVVVGPWLIIQSEGITLRGLEFRPLATGYALQVAQSKRIDVQNGVFEAAEADQEKARGLQIKDSEGVKVTNTRFRHLRYALMGSNVKDLLVEGNDFRNIYGDAMRGWVNSSNLVIRKNFFTDIYIPTASPTHVDAIQFWTVGATAPITDLLIENNVYQRGDGDPAQGIFLGNESMTPYERVTIRNNAIVGSTWNGIWVVGGKDVTITNNLVQHMKWSQRHGDEYDRVQPRIVVKAIEGGLVEGNTARIAKDPKTSLPKIGKNSDAPVAKFGDYTAQQAWIRSGGSSLK